MDFAVATLQRNVGLEAFDAIAGGETAGIPFSAWIAERMGLPMNYVRKKPKGFGRDAQIEGAPVAGKRVLLVEDLTTDGGSKFRFIDAIRAAEGECAHTFVLFFYDIFEQTRPALAAHGVSLHALATCAMSSPRHGRSRPSTRSRWIRSKPSSATRWAGPPSAGAWASWGIPGAS